MSGWRTLRFDFHAMACPCSLQMDGQDECTMQLAATEAIAEVQRIEYKYSRYREDSIVSLINRSAGSDAVYIDDETAGLLEFAGQLWELSNGLFDITSGVLRHAWDFKSGRPPDSATLKQVLPCVGWQQVVREKNQVQIKRPGMELDFGGFGKEYAADRAAVVLKKHGIAHALVNLGGDLHALGGRGLPEIKDKPWHIEIQQPRPNPLHPDGSLAVLPLTRGGLATSGDYERFFIHNGQRYCHILNPHTGWPVNHFQSVSVLAANTTAAGALSTIAMLKGPDAITWLESQAVRYLAVLQNGKILHSNSSIA